MDNRNIISSIVFLTLAVIVLITSFSLGIGSLNNPQTGFMPFWASFLIIVFSLILFGVTYGNRSVAVRWADLWRHIRWHKTVAAVVVLALYVLILPSTGYLIATSILMVILFKLSSMKIWSAALASVLAVIFSYGLFSFILKTPLPRGIWGF